MTKSIGRNRNTNDESTLSDAIALNDTTSVKIADANPDRTFFNISNTTGKQVWLKYQAASVDNDKKGIAVWARTGRDMTPDNWYTGEISAIADSGTPDVNVTEH